MPTRLASMQLSRKFWNPLEHSVLDAALDGRPMEGIPVLDPLEHSVLEMALDGGPLSNLEPLENSVLNVALDGRPMEGMPVLELLEHSVLEMALDSRLMEGMLVLEPLEHLVPDVARDWGDHSLIVMAVPDLLEHSGLGETDDVKPGVVPPEPLEHSVLVATRNEGDVAVASVAKLHPIEHSGVVKRTETISVYLPRDSGRHVTIEPSGTVPTMPSGSAILVDPGGRTALPGDGGPRLGPDVREDDLVLGAAVQLPAENIDQVTLSPVKVRVSTCDVTTDGNIMTGLDSWNVLDQYEGDVLDSDWDDPYAIASAAYVEEGMDLMVHRHRRDPDSSDIRQNWQTDMTPVCQTMSCVARDEWDTLEDDSLTEAFVADGQNMDKFYRQVVSSDEEDFIDSDDGSVMDLVRDTSDGHNMDEYYQRVVSSDEEDLLIQMMGPLRILIGTLRMKRILVIRMMGPLRILKGTLGQRRVGPPFRMQWVHFRLKRLMSGWRLCSVTAYF